MKRIVTRIIVMFLLIGAILAINAIVLDSETRDAEVSADGGKILALTATDVQVFDQKAENPKVEGPPIVLLHCFACSSQWWEPILPLLTQSHRVISIDLLGHGGSEKPKSGYGIDDQADAVAEALNKLRVRNAVVVGHSMGGHVAVTLAGQASELVDRVAVIGTPAQAGQSDLELEAKIASAAVIGQAIWRVRWDSLVEGGYESAFAPGFDFKAAFEDPERVVIDNDAMTFSAFKDAPDESDAHIEESSNVTRLRKSGVPFLAILGDEDQLVDSEEAAASYETVPGAAIQLMAGIGHSPNVEAPDDTAELLLRFAAAASPTAPTPPSEAPSGQKNENKRDAKQAAGTDKKRPSGGAKDKRP